MEHLRMVAVGLALLGLALAVLSAFVTARAVPRTTNDRVALAMLVTSGVALVLAVTAVAGLFVFGTGVH